MVKTLTVNSLDYGSVKPGDIVSLREKGKALVKRERSKACCPKTLGRAQKKRLSD